MATANPGNENWLKISPKGQKFFDKCLTSKLLYDCDRSWRQRRMAKITAVDDMSYLEETTFQFKITNDIIKDALQEMLHSKPSKLTQEDKAYINVIIEDATTLNNIKHKMYVPIDYYPKRNLLHFRITRADNEEAVFLDRFEGTRLTVQAMFITFNKFNTALPDADYQSIWRLLHALVFQSPYTIEEQLKAHQIINCRKCEKEKCEALLVEILKYYFDKEYLHTLFSNNEFIQSKHNISSLCESIDNLQDILANAPRINKNPAINVFMLARAYFKTAELHSKGKNIEDDTPKEELLSQYFEDCKEYLNFLINLNNKHKLVFNEIFKVLNFNAWEYFVYVPMDIIIGESFLLKSELFISQVYKMKIFKFILSLLFPLFYKLQNSYTIKVGNEISLQYEVTCKEPSELAIIFKRSFILINTLIKQNILKVKNFKGYFLELFKIKEKLEEFPISAFFGYSSNCSTYRVQFHTTKEKSDIEKIIQMEQKKRKQKKRVPIYTSKMYYLGVTYKINRQITVLHWIGVLSLIASAYMLITLNNGNGSIIEILDCISRNDVSIERIIHCINDEFINNGELVDYRLKNKSNILKMIIPIISALIIFILGFRVKEKIISDFLKYYNGTILFLIFVIFFSAIIKYYEIIKKLFL